MVRAVLSGRRKEWTLESVLEIIAFGKVFRGIIVGFTKHTSVHEVKDNVAEITAVLDVPRFQKRFAHRPVLVQCELPDAFQQLLSRDVVVVCGLVQLEVLEGVVERLANKVIRAFGESGILFPNRIYNIREIFFAHEIQTMEITTTPIT